jgi:hypothetical protein
MTMHRLGEASRRRFQIFTWGPVAHEDGDFLVDGLFYEDHKAYLAARAADGYYVPIWRKHTDEGISYGLLLDLIATEAGIDAVVEFAGGWEKAFDDGHLPHWSPSFYTGWTDSTGQTSFPGAAIGLYAAYWDTLHPATPWEQNPLVDTVVYTRLVFTDTGDIPRPWTQTPHTNQQRFLEM